MLARGQKRRADGQPKVRADIDRFVVNGPSFVRFTNMIGISDTINFNISWPEGATCRPNGRLDGIFHVIETNPSHSMAVKARLCTSSIIDLDSDVPTYDIADGTLRLSMALNANERCDRLALVGNTVYRCAYQDDPEGGAYVIHDIPDGNYPVRFLRERIISFQKDDKRFTEMNGLSDITLHISQSEMTYSFLDGRVCCNRSFVFSDVNHDPIALQWEEWICKCVVDTNILYRTLADMRAEKIRNVEIRFCTRDAEQEEDEEFDEDGRRIVHQALHLIPKCDPGITTTFKDNFIDCSIRRASKDRGGQGDDQGDQGDDQGDDQANQADEAAGGDSFEVYQRDRYAPASSGSGASDSKTPSFDDAVDSEEWYAFMEWTRSLTNVTYTANFDLAIIFDVVSRIYKSQKNGQMSISLPAPNSEFDFIVVSSKSGNVMSPDPSSFDLIACFMIAPTTDDD